MIDIDQLMAELDLEPPVRIEESRSNPSPQVVLEEAQGSVERNSDFDRKVDLRWEFEAPQWCDFSNENSSSSVSVVDESWFSRVHPNHEFIERSIYGDSGNHLRISNSVDQGVDSISRNDGSLRKGKYSPSSVGFECESSPHQAKEKLLSTPKLIRPVYSSKNLSQSYEITPCSIKSCKSSKFSKICTSFDSGELIKTGSAKDKSPETVEKSHSRNFKDSNLPLRPKSHGVSYSTRTNVNQTTRIPNSKIQTRGHSSNLRENPPVSKADTANLNNGLKSKGSQHMNKKSKNILVTRDGKENTDSGNLPDDLLDIIRNHNQTVREAKSSRQTFNNCPKSSRLKPNDRIASASMEILRRPAVKGKARTVSSSMYSNRPSVRL